MYSTSIQSSNAKESSSHKISGEIFQILGGSLFIALCSQIVIPLTFTPVPITLQTMAVMLLGGMLGSRNGALSVLLYLAEISCGLPVCAGGVSLPFALIGPTGGYLIGMALQAYLIGWCFEKSPLSKPTLALFSLFFTSALQMGLGALWLAKFVGLENSLFMGFVPFIPGEILKCVAAINILSKSQTRESIANINLL